jgi:hypothetical protein
MEPEDNKLRQVLANYFELQDEITGLRGRLETLLARQKTLLPSIHALMRADDLDQVRVRNKVFSRSVPEPRRRGVKDTVLRSVLAKHLGGAGEDNKLRGVLEDIERMRVASAAVPREECLVVRTTKADAVAPK